MGGPGVSPGSHLADAERAGGSCAGSCLGGPSRAGVPGTADGACRTGGEVFVLGGGGAARAQGRSPDALRGSGARWRSGGGLPAGRAGVEIVARRKMMTANDVPVRIATSYFRADLFGGTRLAEPEFVQPSLQSALTALGYSFGHAEEHLTARPPTAFERETLELEAGEWIVQVLRASYSAEGTPVHVLETICAANRHIFSIGQVSGHDEFPESLTLDLRCRASRRRQEVSHPGRRSCRQARAGGWACCRSAGRTTP